MDYKFKINFNTGKSFGLSHEIYKKSLAPNVNPGPGKYKIDKTVGTDRIIVKMKGKKNIDSITQKNPGPNHYKINHTLTQNNRFILILIRYS